MRGEIQTKVSQTPPDVQAAWHNNAINGFHPDNEMRMFDLVGNRFLFAGLTPADPALVQARLGHKAHRTPNVFVAEFEDLYAARNS